MIGCIKKSQRKYNVKRLNNYIMFVKYKCIFLFKMYKYVYSY